MVTSTNPTKSPQGLEAEEFEETDEELPPAEANISPP